MSGTNSDTGSGIPTLLHKLCVHFAKNDSGELILQKPAIIICQTHFPDLAAKLFKVALTYLNSPMPNSKTTSDEQFVVAQIRKMLSNTDQPSEKVQNFDMLYANLQKSVCTKC